MMKMLNKLLAAPPSSSSMIIAWTALASSLAFDRVITPLCTSLHGARAPWCSGALVLGARHSMLSSEQLMRRSDLEAKPRSETFAMMKMLNKLLAAPPSSSSMIIAWTALASSLAFDRVITPLCTSVHGARAPWCSGALVLGARHSMLSAR
ncbi:unnamed protein product [Cochlearia groenlandica]